MVDTLVDWGEQVENEGDEEKRLKDLDSVPPQDAHTYLAKEK